MSYDDLISRIIRGMDRLSKRIEELSEEITELKQRRTQNLSSNQGVFYSLHQNGDEEEVHHRLSQESLDRKLIEAAECCILHFQKVPPKRR